MRLVRCRTHPGDQLKVAPNESRPRIGSLSLSLSCSQKAKEQALQPARSFMMTGFMLWMSGNGVHIFSIMITFYAIYNPIKSAIGVNSAFARFADTKMDGEGRTRQGSHQSHTSLTPVSHQSHTSLTQASHKSHTSLTQVSHKSHTSLALPRLPMCHTPLFLYMSPDSSVRGSLILSKLVYVVLNLVAMLGALYKMSLMGLLPTTPSDWVSFLEVPPAAQFASGSEL